MGLWRLTCGVDHYKKHRNLIDYLSRLKRGIYDMSYFLLPDTMAYYRKDGQIYKVRVLKSNSKNGSLTVEMPDGSLDTAMEEALFADEESARNAPEDKGPGIIDIIFKK